jgi:hypothetical protein
MHPTSIKLVHLHLHLHVNVNALAKLVGCEMTLVVATSPDVQRNVPSSFTEQE